MPETHERNSSSIDSQLLTTLGLLFILIEFWYNYVSHGLFLFGILSSTLPLFRIAFILFCFLMSILFCPTLIFYLNLFCLLTSRCSLKWNVKPGDEIAWESQCVSKRRFCFDKDLATFLKFQIGINKVPFSMVGL